MSVILKKFYNIFWKDKSCQNLFLLSKEELLETINFGPEESSYSYTSNRIIISNAQDDNDVIDTIKFRSEDYDIVLGNSMEEKIEYFKPIIEDFYKKHFEKSTEKLIADFDKKGWRLIIKFLRLLSNQKKMEANTVKLLQEYGFIGKHLNSFNAIETYFQSIFIPKKGNELINEQTITTFFEGIKFIKEIYVNQSYKKLYNTNQVLINTLNSEDNFESRLRLFHHLYESKIISPSKEDAFIECSHCEPGTYKGVFQLSINPKKLKDLTCPICSKELTYFVSYKLDKEIYNIIKEKDGLLQNALCEKLKELAIPYKDNQKYLGDIEIDCLFKSKETVYIIETKMYKLNTTRDKLKSKVKEHFSKLVGDVERLLVLDEFKNESIEPILLLNINDNSILEEVNHELKIINRDEISQRTKIINLSLLKFKN